MQLALDDLIWSGHVRPDTEGGPARDAGGGGRIGGEGHTGGGRGAEEVTVVLVAHRLSTVVNADQIVVLDAGKVAFSSRRIS